MESSSSTRDIDIDAVGIDIDTMTTERNVAIEGVHAWHEGNGNIDISIAGQVDGMETTPSMIDTAGADSFGLYAQHFGIGDLIITLQDVEIRTLGTRADGLLLRHGQLRQSDQHRGSGHLTVDLRTGVTINTAEDSAPGIFADHANTVMEDVNHAILTAQGVSITTAGIESHGARFARINGPGDVRMSFRDSTVETGDRGSVGVYGYRPGVGAGNVLIDVRNSTIHTKSTATDANGQTRSDGILGWHQRGTGDVDIDVQGSSVTTAGEISFGIFGLHQSTGDVGIDVQGGSIDTAGTSSHGVYGLHLSAGASGGIDISVGAESRVTTTGINAYGIYGQHRGTGDVVIDAQNSIIHTQSTSTNSQDQTLSHGIYGDHRGSGTIDIDVQGGSITTAGAFSYGIYGKQEMGASGNIDITTDQDHTTTTTGANARGIVTYHFGTATEVDEVPVPRSMKVTVDGTIDVSGANARGVMVGFVNDDGVPSRMSNLNDEGFRNQVVTVNGAITSTAEGVYLANGGRVIIGPESSIDSGTDIAILATGTVPEVMDDPQTMDIDETAAAIPPKLRVDLNPGGSRMVGAGHWLETALGGGWILNDGGETTIAVNGTVLHEGATGVVSNAVARNGVWDVTMVANGVTVDDRTTDPWTISTRTAGVTADRDFNAEDFTGTEVRCPAGQVGTPPNCRVPPPPMCPAGQVGTPPNCMDPPLIMEEYAPRAALYEALPDFLLGLQTTNLFEHHLLSSELPVWTTLQGSTGDQGFDRSTVGAEYDTEHLMVSAGGTVLENRRWKVDASVHHVSGSADVSSPVRGGDIHAKGQGLSLAVCWCSGGDYHAVGRMDWTEYELDISSDQVGRLVSGVDADRLSLEVEAGRRMAWGERMHWTPHVRLGRAKLSIDSFTDAVQDEVSFPDEGRHVGSLGVIADTMRSAWGGELFLRGLVNLEHRFGDTNTTSRVSGEILRAEPEESSVRVGLGAVWQQGPWVLDAALSAREASGGNHAYSGSLTIGMQF